MAFNAELLQRTMAHIEAHPEQWDQAVWGLREKCGTTACLAGWATMLDDPDHVPPISGNWMVEDRYIEDHATEILGLTDDQADILFRSTRTMGELRALVAVLIESEGGATTDHLWDAIRYV